MGDTDMTKAEAFYQFFSSFALDTYEENSVPGNEDGGSPSFPYLTYELITGSFGDEIPISFSVWYKSTSWKEANRKADEIEKYLGRAGVHVPCDGGSIWFKRGTPFAERMGDASDQILKRISMNLSVEFWTED